MKVPSARTFIFIIICISVILFVLQDKLAFRAYSGYGDIKMISVPNGSLPSVKEQLTVIRSTSIGPNYHLWSKNPWKIDWSKSESMCHSILNSQNISDDIFRIAQNWSIPNAHDDASMAQLLSNCTNFHSFVPFVQNPFSQEELEYPVAYVVMLARNAAQSVRYFRMIYQPQNAYCLAYDKKSPEEYENAITQLAQCFKDNVFLIPEPREIYYFHHSILYSIISCMKELLNKWPKIKWKYVQITNWNDFPLKTNAQTVDIFKILNGSQDVSLDPILSIFFTGKPERSPNDPPKKKIPPRSIPPDGLKIYKGSQSVSMTKELVEFIFTNPTAQRYLDWVKYMTAAEEHYFQTLIHNIHLNAPGQFPGECIYFYYNRKLNKPWISRFQVWDHQRSLGGSIRKWQTGPCYGKFVHGSCLFGVKDIPNLISQPHLMAHKIYEEFQPFTLFCLEQWYWKEVRNGTALMDESYYGNFPSVTYQNMMEKNKFVC